MTAGLKSHILIKTLINSETCFSEVSLERSLSIDIASFIIFQQPITEMEIWRGNDEVGF